jgi:hypothetical protein
MAFVSYGFVFVRVRVHQLVTPVPLVKDRKETKEIMDKIQAFLKLRDRQEEEAKRVKAGRSFCFSDDSNEFGVLFAVCNLEKVR